MPETPGTEPEDTCRVYADDEGQPIRVQGGAPMDEEGQAAMRQLVGAAKRRMRREKAEEEAAIRADERAKVAEEIERVLDEDGDGSSWDGGMARAAAIARGEQP